MSEMPQIGKNLQALRKKIKLTLDELAKKCGVSKGMLSQIEKGKVNPTVATMWKISQALGVDFNTMLGSQENDRLFYVSRYESMTVLSNNDHSCELRVITPPQMVDQLELYWLSFQPKGLLESEPHFSFTEEIVTVVEGSIEVSAGDKTDILQKGDSVRYHADVKHSLREMANENTRAFLTVIFPQAKEDT